MRPEGWSQSLIGNDYVEIGVALRLWNEDGAHHMMQERMRPWTSEELSQEHGVPTDIRNRLTEWLTASGLTVTRQSPYIIWLEGTFAEAGRTFDIRFDFRQEEAVRHFRLDREPEVPDWAVPWIAGIVGLENVARMQPRFVTPSDAQLPANQGQGFFPSDLESAYGFPAAFDGTGQTIGLLEFSNGYSQSDVDGFWQQMGISPPAVAFVSVDGTPNDGGISSADMEATLDVEWAGAMAPGANLVVYEASSGSSDQSFGVSVLKALDYAVHDTTRKPSVLSISYGDGESRFPASEMQAWDSAMAEGTLLGVTTFVASGDQGAYGLHGPGSAIPHADAPANCPHAVAVGGTHLELNPNGTIKSETGWTDTNNNGASGGGISQVFPVPSYQAHLTLPVMPGDRPGRGIPDVAANADPDTGYAVMFQGSMTVIGGTSAACPLWAALWARVNQARAAAKKGPVGYANPLLYDLGPTSAFRDIVSGNNSYGMVPGYDCGPGWDAVTGWGSPYASRIIGELS